MKIEFEPRVMLSGIYIEFGINECKIISDPFHENHDVHLIYTITKLEGIKPNEMIDKINQNYYKIPILIIDGKMDHHVFDSILNDFNN